MPEGMFVSPNDSWTVGPAVEMQVRWMCMHAASPSVAVMKVLQEMMHVDRQVLS